MSTAITLTSRSDERISRYMDFVKFAALIDSGIIWFSRADRFEDPAEVNSQIVPFRSTEPTADRDRNPREMVTQDYE
jgi:hypothetical protein